MALPSKSDHDLFLSKLTSLDLADAAPSPAFHLFPSLPPELRFKIWRLAAPKPAVVERTINNTTMAFGLRRRVPAILQVCRESRAELLYRANDRHGSRDNQFELLHLSSDQKGVYINYRDDTLLIYRGEWLPLQNLRPPLCFSRTNKQFPAPQFATMPHAANFAKVQHLAMEWGLRPCWVQQHCRTGALFVHQFPQLRTLTLLVTFKIYNTLPLGEPGSKHREQTQKRRALNEIKGWVLEALAQERAGATDANALPSPEVRVVPKTKFWTTASTAAMD
ncbi:hypothetical protein CSUB01_10704 [Colletotrichum sublineola]|uniref:2EXR domain-containing protein n=1 Tax=Colletotrichum sublineola TaxID=1173701 RepID=A0A066X747_COLSU|nr:hypothetical protein CSUB01_10704 [Colletotrichum sublineola]